MSASGVLQTALLSCRECKIWTEHAVNDGKGPYAEISLASFPISKSQHVLTKGQLKLSRRRQMQAWQPKEGGLLATGGDDGKIFIYNIRDVIEGVPQMCIPCATAETLDDPPTQVAWGPDNQLYTGHTSGKQGNLPRGCKLLFCLPCAFIANLSQGLPEWPLPVIAALCAFCCENCLISFWGPKYWPCSLFAAPSTSFVCSECSIQHIVHPSTGLVRQWKLPELPITPFDPIMASYAFLGKEHLTQPQMQS